MRPSCGCDGDAGAADVQGEEHGETRRDRILSSLRRLDRGVTGQIPEEHLFHVLRSCTPLTDNQIRFALEASSTSGPGGVEYARLLGWAFEGTPPLRGPEPQEATAVAPQCCRAGTWDLGSLGGCTIGKAEERAITLAQLRAVGAHASRRCSAEGWTSTDPRESRPLSAQTVTLYDLVHYVVKPLTAARRCSYVELVAAGPQVPAWFVSHWWGEPILEFVACLKQHMKDRQLAGDSPYWVCAYANNQWQLGGDLVGDPAETSFAKAMRLARGTVSVLDSQATCYTRAWCGYEVYVSLRAGSQGSYKYDMYTAIQGDDGLGAVGITDGIAEADCWRCEKYWKENQFTREKDFPAGLACGALSFRVQGAQASEELNRNRILNTIARQRDLDSQPPAESAHFEEVNQVLRGRFAAATWRVALEQHLGLGGHCAALLASALPELRLSFEGCEPFGNAALRLLAQALPRTLKVLELDLASRALSWAGGRDLGEGLAGLRGLRSLTLSLHHNSLGAAGAMHLSGGLAHLSLLSSLSLRLGRNGLGEEGARHLGEALQALGQLSSLTLGASHNRLPAEAARWLGSGIERLQNLTSLHLSLRDNHLGDEGARYLGLSIGKLPGTLVELYLNLYGNQLEDDGAGYVGEGVEKLPQLSTLTLWLNYNHFGEEGKRRVHQSVEKLTGLSAVDLDLGQGGGGFLMG